MTILRKLAIALTLSVSFGAPMAAVANEAGDLVFTERGPWQLKDQGPVWAWNVVAPTGVDLHSIKDGTLSLIEITDPSDGKPVLQLVEKGTGPERRIGPFPTDGGDPSVVFFLESIARNMAASTGGSPFYIRNRIKDAIFRGGEIQTEGDTQVAVFRPFAADPNKDRMKPFDQLEMRFTLADPKAPIQSMVASTGGESPAFLVSLVQP